MIKVILFDCDGLIIRHEKYFSIRLAEQQGMTLEDENEKQKAFFSGVFLEYETGKADLKDALKKDLGLWNWTGTVEGLIDFWFSGEATVENDIKDFILNLRKKGFKCFVTTNNEKYRGEYLWSTAGLKNIFDGFFSSSTVGYFKEDQEFWKEVYKKFPEVKKEEILVWDDDSQNVESATKFGFNAEFYKNFEEFKTVIKEKYNL